MSTDYPSGPKWTQAHMAHLFNLILNDNPKPLLDREPEEFDREAPAYDDDRESTEERWR